MMKKRIYLSSPHMSDESYELEFVHEAFDTNWIAPTGSNIGKFEEEVADYVGINHAVAVSSGTGAIHLAMKLAGVEAGDRVFCQSFTFVATANPIIYEKAIPVFIDSDEETWNMDPNRLEEAFEKYPETKVVIIAHLYGMSADVNKILDICRKHDAVLIEDAAESLGTKYKGQYSGTHGDYGIYSFNGNKIITTGGGGMLISNDQKSIDKARYWATQAREDETYYQHTEVGYNYRLSNVLAGIGRGQLKILEERIDKKRYIYNFYKKNLNHIEDIQFMPENEWDEPNRWLSAIMLHGAVRPIEVLTALEKENIEARYLWKPMHLQPLFEKYDFIGGTFSEQAFENGLCLPSDTKMDDGDLWRVVETIEKLWE